MDMFFFYPFKLPLTSVPRDSAELDSAPAFPLIEPSFEISTEQNSQEKFWRPALKFSEDRGDRGCKLVI